MKTGFFDLNHILEQHNADKKGGLKKLDKFMGLKSTEKLINSLSCQLWLEDGKSQADNYTPPKKGELEIMANQLVLFNDREFTEIDTSNVLKIKQGKSGGTFTHYVIMSEFLMWLSVDYKILAHRLASSLILGLRDEAGDNFNSMRKALKEKGVKSKYEYINETDMINLLVFGTTEAGQRNLASESQLDLLNKLQKLNTYLIEEGFDKQQRKEKCISYIKLYNLTK
jgi:hypothetical protein